MPIVTVRVSHGGVPRSMILGEDGAVPSRWCCCAQLCPRSCAGPTSSRPTCPALPVAVSRKVLPVMPRRQPAPITQPGVWLPQSPAAELHILLPFLTILQVLLEAGGPDRQNHPQLSPSSSFPGGRFSLSRLITCQSPREVKASAAETSRDARVLPRGRPPGQRRWRSMTHVTRGISKAERGVPVAQGSSEPTGTSR